ncbi:MAG: hypothetical protein K8H88_34775, partial [Sandaracinaceae bacterium]|nr:hypothetical protein [Sandaracinaceae bacterium]
VIDVHPAGWTSMTLYADADDDGYCVSPATTRCTDGAAPSGYRELSGCLRTDDCDDGNASYWQVMSARPDADLDGYCDFFNPILACAGATFPPGTMRMGCPADCHDGNASFWLGIAAALDRDRDRHCVGRPYEVCTNGTLPPEFSQAGCDDFADCNDSSTTWWRTVTANRDADNDGHCTNERADVCAGASAPPGWNLSCASFGDCNESDPNLWRVVSCRPDADGDGWCASSGFSNVCIGAACPSCTPNDCNDNNAAATAICSYSEVGPSRSHCCCGCCPCTQPNPHTNADTFCIPGFAISSCAVARSSGSGPVSATIVDAHTCSISQGCNICDGSSANLVVTCTAL